VFIKKIQVFLENSSMNVTKYDAPCTNATDINPPTYECIISNIPLDLFSLLGKETLAFFPSAHTLHTPCYSILNYVRPITIPLRVGNDL
jgi:hypothetical protein